MIERVACAPEDRDALERVRLWLGSSFAISCEAPASAVPISAESWWSPRADLLRLDRVIHHREDSGEGFCLLLVDSGAHPAELFEQVLTRYQRLLRFAKPTEPGVARVLARHRSLYDLSKPLVRADYDHALDTWRWTLRLDLGASRALQLAALFHDIERLISEPDERIEHLAPSYRAFKDAHARSGGRLAGELLVDCGVTPGIVARARRLIERHEASAEEEDLAALNDADALSFFSLNSWGFVEYFGLAHTRTKIAYTLQRMRPAARRYLNRLRYHPQVEALLHEELARLTLDSPSQFPAPAEASR